MEYFTLYHDIIIFYLDLIWRNRDRKNFITISLFFYDFIAFYYDFYVKIVIEYFTFYHDFITFCHDFILWNCDKKQVLSRFRYSIWKPLKLKKTRHAKKESLSIALWWFALKGSCIPRFAPERSIPFRVNHQIVIERRFFLLFCHFLPDSYLERRVKSRTFSPREKK